MRPAPAGSDRPRPAAQNSPLARCAAVLRYLAPEAGLAAMPRPQPGQEGVMRLEPAVVADAGLQRAALEKVTRRVPVARGLGTLECVLDHRPAQQGGSER